MSPLSSPGREQVESLARQTGFSSAAVESMALAIARGGGRMAQFDHPEFGGSGQWMQGGMVMIGDWSDRDLKRRVTELCEALAGAIGSGSTIADPDARSADRSAGAFEPGPAWYPAALGRPDSSGSQNRMRYAWFGDARRLALDDGNGVTIYDTGDHRIGGVSQQQGREGSVSFVSQHGAVDLDRLPVVDEIGDHGSRATEVEPVARSASPDPFVAIEKLADLHARGVLDDAEFAAKKAQLLEWI